MIRTRAQDGGGAYLLLDGSRPMTGDLNLGGNKLVGDSISGGNLILESTSHATKGEIYANSNFYPGTPNVTRIGNSANYFYSMHCRYYNFIGLVGFFNTTILATRQNAAGVLKFKANGLTGTDVAEITTSGLDFTIYRAGDITMLANKTVSGLGDVRAPNLPAADPSDGLSKLWNNAGVVTVGT